MSLKHAIKLQSEFNRLICCRTIPLQQGTVRPRSHRFKHLPLEVNDDQDEDDDTSESNHIHLEIRMIVAPTLENVDFVRAFVFLDLKSNTPLVPSLVHEWQGTDILTGIRFNPYQNNSPGAAMFTPSGFNCYINGDYNEHNDQFYMFRFDKIANTEQEYYSSGQSAHETLAQYYGGTIESCSLANGYSNHGCCANETCAMVESEHDKFLMNCNGSFRGDIDPTLHDGFRTEITIGQPSKNNNTRLKITPGRKQNRRLVLGHLTDCGFYLFSTPYCIEAVPAAQQVDLIKPINYRNASIVSCVHKFPVWHTALRYAGIYNEIIKTNHVVKRVYENS